MDQSIIDTVTDNLGDALGAQFMQAVAAAATEPAATQQAVDDAVQRFRGGENLTWERIGMVRDACTAYVAAATAEPDGDVSARVEDTADVVDALVQPPGAASEAGAVNDEPVTSGLAQLAPVVDGPTITTVSGESPDDSTDSVEQGG